MLAGPPLPDFDRKRAENTAGFGPETGLIAA